MLKRFLSLMLAVLLIMSFAACKKQKNNGNPTASNTSSGEQIDLTALEFQGEPYVVLNGNVPLFKEAEKRTESYEFYGELDKLGRCTYTEACIGKDLMPTEKRGEIGMVKPSGWQTAKYDVVDGKYLYNRCHLIGFQLAGENANEKNLITGTRYMNVDGMLPFENMVADYVKETGNHCMYRVIPVFKDNELVARGVTMEAYSVEDKGEGICFFVFCFNAQPQIEIDYASGESRFSGDQKQNTESTASKDPKSTTYVLNTSTKKFHLPECQSAKDMKEANKKTVTATREELIKEGYAPCGSCKP